MNTIKDMTNFIFINNQMDRQPLEEADIVFIPGCSRPEMMEEAVRLFHKGLAPYLLPSGKYSITLGHFAGVSKKADFYSGDYKTESEFLFDVGIKNGVPKENLLIEDQATYTMQNAVFSKTVTQALDIIVKKAIICCKSFHARRAYMYYQAAFPDTKFRIAPVDIDGITKENWFRSKEGRKHISGELMRIASQFDDLVPMDLPKDTRNPHVSYADKTAPYL